MKLQQLLINQSNEQRIVSSNDSFDGKNADLILAFGQRTLLEDVNPYQKLRSSFPNAQIVICSSSGQISDQCTIQKEIVATAIDFEKTTVKTCEFDIVDNNDINDLGKMMKDKLSASDLKSILILSEGTHINGTELINELIKQTDKQIPIFGGLAGDEYSFEKTIVGLNHDATAGKIVAIGFYGNNIRFGFGSEGGWGDFGLGAHAFSTRRRPCQCGNFGGTFGEFSRPDF